MGALSHSSKTWRAGLEPDTFADTGCPAGLWCSSDFTHAQVAGEKAGNFSLYFWHRVRAYMDEGYGREGIQILLFPLRPTVEVRRLLRGPADSMPRLQTLDSHPKSAPGLWFHACPAGIGPHLGHVPTEVRRHEACRQRGALPRISAASLASHGPLATFASCKRLAVIPRANRQGPATTSPRHTGLWF